MTMVKVTIRRPGMFESTTKDVDKLGEGITAVWGSMADGKKLLQSIEFDGGKYSNDAIVKWLSDNQFEYVGEFETVETKASRCIAYDHSKALYFQSSKQATPVKSFSTDPLIHRYKKEIIHVGNFYKESDDLEFTVTAATLQHWAQTFKAYTQSGNKVSVPKMHWTAGNPDENAGWVVDMTVDGDGLFATMELVGDEKEIRELVLKSDVSIYVPNRYVDGNGNVFIEPIEHVALCTDPVIPGLKPFEALAASRQNQNTKEKTDMDFAKIVEALGLSKDTKDENVVLDSIKGLIEKASSVDAMAEQVKTLSAEKDAAVALSKTTTEKDVDPMVVNLTIENREMRLSRLVDGAKITPAVADKIKGIFVNKDNLGKRLSKNGGDDGFNALCEALNENDVVSLGERTGAQLLELSKPGAAKSNPIMDDVKRRREAAGLK